MNIQVQGCVGMHGLFSQDLLNSTRKLNYIMIISSLMFSVCLFEVFFIAITLHDPIIYIYTIPSTLFRTHASHGTFRTRKPKVFLKIFTVVYCTCKQHHFHFYLFISNTKIFMLRNFYIKLKTETKICQLPVIQCGLRYLFFWHVFCQMHYPRRQKNIHQLVKKYFFLNVFCIFKTVNIVYNY